MARLVRLAALSVASGCGGPTFEEVRTTCGLDESTFVPLPSGSEGTYHAIESPCSEALVEAFDVDWLSFDGEPPGRVVSLDSDGDALISGLHTLLFSDQGTLGEVASTADPDEAIIALWEACDPRQRLAPEASLGEFWFRCARWSTTTLRIKDPRTYEGMSYELGIVNISPDVDLGRTSIGYAATFAHEVSHCCTPDHVDPSEGEDGFDSGLGVKYDLDSRGAFATGVRVLWQWLNHNEAQGAESDLEQVRSELATECSWIIDPGALAPACAAE